MKCIDNELIQRYIDGEASPFETERVEKHIAECSQCARNVEEQRAFACYLKKEIGQWGKQPVIIPEFIAPFITPRRRLNLKIRHYVYAVSAACVIFLIVFLFPDKNKNKEIRMIYSLEGDYDSNRTVSQQEMTIIIIDADGKIIEY